MDFLCVNTQLHTICWGWSTLCGHCTNKCSCDAIFFFVGISLWKRKTAHNYSREGIGVSNDFLVNTTAIRCSCSLILFVVVRERTSQQFNAGLGAHCLKMNGAINSQNRHLKLSRFGYMLLTTLLRFVSNILCSTAHTQSCRCEIYEQCVFSAVPMLLLITERTDSTFAWKRAKENALNALTKLPILLANAVCDTMSEDSKL